MIYGYIWKSKFCRRLKIQSDITKLLCDLSLDLYFNEQQNAVLLVKQDLLTHSDNKRSHSVFGGARIALYVNFG